MTQEWVHTVGKQIQGVLGAQRKEANPICDGQGKTLAGFKSFLKK